MATYDNDLRLKEIATGDESGGWGTSTNTNLSLIADAFGYGSEAITTNADTHTTTIADFSADAGRALYLKYTGTLDSACTITIGPNTVSKLWFIENATSGSQNIIIKQGSGATVTIANGQVKAIYSDGAGSGGAMVDAFQDLSVPDLFVDDDLSLQSDSAILNFGADADVNLTHVADTGLLLNSSRQLQFGDSGTYIHQSADGVLDLVSDTELELNATTIDINGAVDISGNCLVSGEVQTANIGFTDGDNAMTIADGGGVTFPQIATFTSGLDCNDANITNVGNISVDGVLGDADSNTAMTFSTDDKIRFQCAGENQLAISNGAILPETDDDLDLGSSSREFKDGYFDGTLYTDTISNSGSITSATYFYSSDAALKEDIQTIENPLEKVQALRGVSYKWKDTGRKDIGLVADEVQEVLPELVVENEHKQMDYGHMIGLLVEAIKEQQKEIEELKCQK